MNQYATLPYWSRFLTQYCKVLFLLNLMLVFERYFSIRDVSTSKATDPYQGIKNNRVSTRGRSVKSNVPCRSRGMIIEILLSPKDLIGFVKSLFKNLYEVRTRNGAKHLTFCIQANAQRNGQFSGFSDHYSRILYPKMILFLRSNGQKSVFLDQKHITIDVVEVQNTHKKKLCLFSNRQICLDNYKCAKEVFLSLKHSASLWEFFKIS